MRARLLKWWDLLRSGFWFIPSLMAASAVAVAVGMVEADKLLVARGLLQSGWTYTGGAQGASAVLQTIAGSMITIAGVVFSLTLVALSLASSQFGPRLLRNFMRDRSNQVVLGTFVATFLYCLLVLRTIRRAEEGGFVPHLSITLGVLFALVSLWVLIYFIHHISTSIQADHIIARVGSELMTGIDRLFPEQIGEDPDRSDGNSDGGFPDEPSARVTDLLRAERDGYLQLVAADSLMTRASREDVLLVLRHRPGDYVVKGSVLAELRARGPCDDELMRALHASFALGEQRTPVQDLRFTIQQLAEIAIRALSPGINDPFTAIACVDRLGSALCRLATRSMPSPRRYDERGRLRIVAPATRFPELLDAAFDDLRRYAGDSPSVLARLMQTIATIAGHADRREDREALLRHAGLTHRAAQRAMPDEEDRQAAHAQYQEALRALRRPVRR